MKKITETISILCLVAGLALSFYFYSLFPERVATHWGLNGMPDGYSGKAFAAFFFPILNVGMYLLLTFIPKIDPNRARYEEFAKSYGIFKTAIILFMTVLYILVGLNGIGYAMSIDIIVPILMGILFMILGNYMGKIKNNWFVGIRTPWTLSSESVWNKTHRLGGKLFMIAGALCVLTAWTPGPIKFAVVMISVVLAALVPFVYSYVLYRKVGRDESSPQI